MIASVSFGRCDESVSDESSPLSPGVVALVTGVMVRDGEGELERSST